MSFLTFLFYLFLFILIRIGEIIINILHLPSTGNLKLVKKTKTKTYKKKDAKRKSVKTISFKSGKIFALFSNFLNSVRKGIKAIFHGIEDFIGFVVLLIVRIILFPFVVLGYLFFRKKKTRKYKKKIVRTPITYKFKYIFIGGVIALLFFFIPATFLIFITDLPKLSGLSVNYISKTTKIFDRNGTLLFEIYANQNRTIVGLDKIPKDLINATVAIEDQDFYKHSGFDVRGIARAMYVDITQKDFQGGSTITQQLVKSALLTPEATLSRKAKEIVLAFWAEQKYAKDEILELYFNYVPYGGTAWGVESASQIFFGKSVSDLTLAESAFLAGLPQAPSVYSPFVKNGENGKRRQKDVLNAMVKQGYISRPDAQKAYAQKLEFNAQRVPIKAPHFVMYVKDYLVQKYGLPQVERGGLQVTTTLDLDTQKFAEGIVRDEVDKSGNLGIGNGAAIVSNPSNGDILAMVGSRDYFDPEHDGNVNIATSLRQPGSTIKLVTYALALENGMTETTILDDSPLTVTSPGAPPYKPVNYDGKYHGKIPLRIAFANSYNIPAVRVAQRLGVDEIVDFGKKLGITSWNRPQDYGVSITLGAAEVSMVDLATVYGTVANSGEKMTLDPILKVTDTDGKLIYEKDSEGEQVMKPGVAYIISDILSDNKARSLSFGSNSPLVIPDHKVSVKTGTTDNKRDNWTIGFTPNLLVATWVGNNDNTPLSQALASGITGAAPMWSKIMNELIVKSAYAEMEVPEDVISKRCYGYNAYFLVGTDGKDNCRYRAPTPTFQQQ